MVKGRLNGCLLLCRSLLGKHVADMISKLPWFGRRVHVAVTVNIDFHDNGSG